MTAENLVAIHPHKAAVLATELRRTALGLFEHSGATFDALVQGLEDPALAVALYDATEWFGAEARALQRTLDELVSVLAVRPVDEWAGVAVWRHPYALAFDNPDAAMAAAREAARLLPALVDRGDEDPNAGERLRTILEAWAGNEAFAVELARSVVHAEDLGVGAIGQLLRLEAAWRRHGRSGAPGGQAPVRHLLFTTLATASGSGWLGFRFADLRRDLAGDDVITEHRAHLLAPLGALFAAGNRWGADFLLEAMDDFVRPVNRAFARGEIVFAEGGADPRVGVLQAVALDPAASAALLARPGALDDLFAARYGYGDRGQALADVLQAGTAPPTAADLAAAERAHVPASAPAVDRAAANMMQFVVWALQHRDLPPMVKERLGTVAAPWIASFRKPTYDEHLSLEDPHGVAGQRAVGNPLGALTDANRLAFLDLVADDVVALGDLRVAELLWIRLAFRRLARSGFDGRGIALVANVDHRTSRAVRAGMLRNLQREDQRIALVRELWGHVVSVVTLFMADYVDLAVDTGVRLVGGLARPPSTLAIDDATSYPAHIESDERKLEWALMAALWDERAQHHVFDGVVDPPMSIVVGEPRQLLPITEMTAAQYEEWLGWIDANGLRRRAHWEELTVGADG